MLSSRGSLVDFLADWIAATVEPGTDHEPAAVGGVADEIDHGLVAAQRASTAVDRDKREEPVFDVVPLARSWHG